MLLLFDVDGTLTTPRNRITTEFKHYLYSLNSRGIRMGVVSGSDLSKLKEQIGDDILDIFYYVFTENGLVSYVNGVCNNSESIVDYFGEKNYCYIVNSFLRVLSEIELPVKRGNFLELRNGMLNVCPIGRSCTQQERDDFEKYDTQHRVRETVITKAREWFDRLDIQGVQMSIGGQISIDVFPQGWNKTYCLKFLSNYYDSFGSTSIHFFGDRIFPGGNDYEIATDKRVIPHSVISPEETKQIIERLLN